MKTMWNRLKALHRDEQGADMIEYVLIVAAIALPILGVLIFYWNDLKDWIQSQYEDVTGRAP